MFLLLLGLPSCMMGAARAMNLRRQITSVVGLFSSNLNAGLGPVGDAVHGAFWTSALKELRIWLWRRVTHSEEAKHKSFSYAIFKHTPECSGSRWLGPGVLTWWVLHKECAFLMCSHVLLTLLA